MSQDCRRIYWLASYPKSGNTWARMLLNCYVTKFPPDINSAFQFAMSDSRASDWQSVCSVALNELTTIEAVYMRPSVLMHKIHARWPVDVYMKTHCARVCVEEIPLIPRRLTKGAVYLVRDPRDVAISFAKHIGKSIDEAIRLMSEQEALLKNWGTNICDWLLTWDDHVASWSRDEGYPVHVIRYEDLFTKDGVKELLVGCGEPRDEIDEDLVDYAMDKCSFAALRGQESQDGFKEAGKHTAFFRVGKVGQWRDVLSRSQVTELEKAHGRTMVGLGYRLEETEDGFGEDTSEPDLGQLCHHQVNSGQ